MTAEVSSGLHYANYPKFDTSRIFDVTVYPTQNDDSTESGSKKPEIINLNGVEDLINTYQIKDTEKQKENVLEAEDVLTDLDIKEIERRQREANEETTRSEDLRQFLQVIITIHDSLISNSISPVKSPIKLRSKTVYSRSYKVNYSVRK